MYYCPECDSDNVELIDDSEVIQRDKWSWTDVSVWECKDCGCKFEKIESTDVDLEVIEHGEDYGD